MITIALPTNLVKFKTTTQSTLLYEGAVPVWKLVSICTEGDRVVYASSSSTTRYFDVPSGTIVINALAFQSYRMTQHVGIWSYGTNSIALDNGAFKTLEKTSLADNEVTSRYAIPSEITDTTTIGDVLSESFEVTSTMRTILAKFDAGFNNASTIYSGFVAEGSIDNVISQVSPVNWKFESPWNVIFNFSGDQIVTMFAYLGEYSGTKYPITYSATNGTVTGPVEAAIGETVVATGTPNANYAITDYTTQIAVTCNDIPVPFTYNAITNEITFEMPDPTSD